MVVLMLFAFTACEAGGTGSSDGSTSGPTIYAIGDTGPSGVGIVFYITDGGLQGLEVAPEDQHVGAPWSNITGEVGTVDWLYFGISNSYAITHQSGHTASAAQICLNYDGGGKDDWYLPSIEELRLVWDNLVQNNSGVGGFANAKYWSSSEIQGSSNSVMMKFFGIDPYLGSGYEGWSPKSSIYRIRAIRYF